MPMWRPRKSIPHVQAMRLRQIHHQFHPRNKTRHPHHSTRQCRFRCLCRHARRAALLHDDNVLLFPGTQEKACKRLYNNLDRQRYNFMEAAEIPWAEIDRLVLVDTRQKGRLRHCPPARTRGAWRLKSGIIIPIPGMTSSRPKPLSQAWALQPACSARNSKNAALS